MTYPALIAETPPQTPSEQQRMFHLPEGFEIELVASEPDVIKPININFDAEGRLLVSQSVEYPFPAAPDREGRDSIKLILDKNGDGVPETVTTFASGLNIPIGVTPVPKGVLGYSVPKVFYFPDANDDGKADEAIEEYAAFGFADTHGMVSSLTWWIDGWIYGCHGFANTSIVSGADDDSITMWSGNTYRLKADGSHIEHFTYGQVNPFGLSFDPLGNAYTADCHTKPATMLLRGATYPRSEDGLGVAPALMEHSHGSTGIAGIAYYAADQFPEEYQDTLFIGNPITGRVNHDRLEQHGSTYKGIELEDFLSCDDPWFRPVDVQLAPDGTLYIADFYNRIIGHYEVPLDHPMRDKERGRIWRVVYTGDKKESPAAKSITDLSKLSADQLVEQLANPCLTARVHATHQLVHRIGRPAAEKVRAMLAGNTSSGIQRAHGLWVLERLGGLDAGMIRKYANDPDALTRVHLMHIIGDHSEWSDEEQALALQALEDDDAFVRRAAVEGLALHPDAKSVNPLLNLWANTDPQDAQLVHAIRLALRATIRDLKILPELAQQYRNQPNRLQQLTGISLGIDGPESAEFLLDYYSDHPLSGIESAGVLEHIGRYIPDDKMPKLFFMAESAAGDNDTTAIAVFRALRSVAQRRGVELPDQISTRGTNLVLKLLASEEPLVVANGMQLAADMKLADAFEPIARYDAKGVGMEDNLRRQAIMSLVAIDANRASKRLLAIAMDKSSATVYRGWAAEELGNLNQPEIREQLVEQLRVVPQELALKIARGLVASPEGSEALLQALEKGAATPRLLQDIKVNGLLLASGIPDIELRKAKLLKDLPPSDTALHELIASRRLKFPAASSDPDRGEITFTKNCAICHRIGEKGERVGPELDGIGLRGPDRLLEDVLDPSRNVDAKYRSALIQLDSSGRTVIGLVQSEDEQLVHLVDDQGKKQDIPVSDIAARKNLNLSAMPANVAEKMTEGEFFDLLAFLLEQQKEPPPTEPSPGK